MFKKFQILLAWLGMTIILLHGAVPHHHHDPDTAVCQENYASADIHDDCYFEQTHHQSHDDIICHFRLIFDHHSISNYFTSPVSLIIPVVQEPREVTFGSDNCKLFLSKKIFTFSLRAPPSVA